MNLNKVKISIIIPVYNSSKLVGRTLDNILEQSIEGIEIICVDDGSTDDSLEVLNEYAKKFEIIKVYSYGENRGQAYARNVGFDHATGEYVYYMDSDDYILDRDALKNIYARIRNFDAEILMFNAKIEYENEKAKELYQKPIKDVSFGSLVEGIRYSGDQALSLIIQAGDFFGPAWTYLYNRDFLKSNGIYFVEKTSPHEDTLFTFYALLNANNVFYYDTYVYKYIIRNNSSIHDERKIGKRIKANINVYNEGRRIVSDKHDISDELWEALPKYFVSLLHLARENKRLIYENWEELGYVLSPRDNMEIFQYLISRYDYLYRFFTKKEYDDIKTAKSVIIYGNGKVAKSVELLLRDIGISDISFVVTNSNDAIIKSIYDYRDSINENVVILAVHRKSAKEEMLGILDELGAKRLIVI